MPTATLTSTRGNLTYGAGTTGGLARLNFFENFFQNFLDRELKPIGALAHLGLARAYSMQGDTAKAKAAYQDFLTFWKDADPDIPIFIVAKAEYAKLQ